ncbi:MAG TPA: GNAT family N-acetyltransferase [Mycobacteriales bacterium]|nr:GNAT family N-acetyltransferase [Mycobacteriales bacterium]
MIRRITLGDVDVYRQVRLTALAESPSAFASTYATEAAFPDEVWAQRTAHAADGDERAMFLAYEAGECIGLAGATSDDLGADMQLISMWVAPAYRGTGVAAQLVDSVVEWCAQGGARNVALWVSRGNDRARRLYERMGFVVTGDVQPLPSDPCKDEIRMLRTMITCESRSSGPASLG